MEDLQAAAQELQIEEQPSPAKQTSTSFTGQSITNQLNKYLVSSQNKSYFVVAITVLFVLVIGLLGIRPAFTAVLNQNSNNGLREDVIGDLTEKLNTLRSLEIQTREKNALVDLFDEVFPNEIRQDLILSELDELTAQYNLLVEDITFTEIDRDVNLQVEFGVNQNVSSVIVTLAARGEREDLLDFLQSLESAKRIYNITSVSITRQFVENEQGQRVGGDFVMNFSSQTYYVNIDNSSINQPIIF